MIVHREWKVKFIEIFLPVAHDWSPQCAAYPALQPGFWQLGTWRFLEQGTSMFILGWGDTIHKSSFLLCMLNLLQHSWAHSQVGIRYKRRDCMFCACDQDHFYMNVSNSMLLEKKKLPVAIVSVFIFCFPAIIHLPAAEQDQASFDFRFSHQLFSKPWWRWQGVVCWL